MTWTNNLYKLSNCVEGWPCAVGRTEWDYSASGYGGSAVNVLMSESSNNGESNAIGATAFGSAFVFLAVLCAYGYKKQQKISENSDDQFHRSAKIC